MNTKHFLLRTKHVVLVALSLLILGSCSSFDGIFNRKNVVVLALLKPENTYEKQIAQGLKKRCQKMGYTLEITYAPADGGSNGQIQLMQAVRSDLFAGVILDPMMAEARAESSARGTAFETAVRQLCELLPVVLVDTPMDEALPYKSFVRPQYEQASQKMAFRMLNLEPALTKVALLAQGNTPALTERYAAFQTFMSGFGVSTTLLSVPVNTLTLTQLNALSLQGYTCLASLDPQTTERLLEITDATSPFRLYGTGTSTPICDAVRDGRLVLSQAFDTIGLGAAAMDAFQAYLISHETIRDLFTVPFLLESSNLDSEEALYYRNPIE